ncbi:MAG: hypothetical protein JSS49_19615 [Planctomycetes bacterium]|nr:hypothetical protein [Planctomycetota bacterium]
MRFQGSVSLALLLITHTTLAQDPVSPLPLDDVERQISPELNAFPQTTGPTRSVDAETPFESEVEALRADLKSFHALSEEVARIARSAEMEADRTSFRQRQEMLDILTRLATQGIQRPVTRPEDRKPVLIDVAIPPTPEPIEVPAVTDSAVDQFALGKVLFRANDFKKAEQAFRKVTPSDENRLLLKYLIATCLRKQSQWQPAIDAYREVAASDKDPVLRDLARFQLDGIRWNQETEKQIEQIRKQREKSVSKPTP